MREITTETIIDASPARVWKVLTSFDEYALWNPFIIEASGQAEAGTRLRIRTRFEKRGAMEFRPLVLASEPARELRWKGRLFVAGLFDGEHRFVLEPLRDGRTRLVQSERFTGILIPILWSGMNGPTREGFEAMNRALRGRAEAGS